MAFKLTPNLLSLLRNPYFEYRSIARSMKVLLSWNIFVVCLFVFLNPVGAYDQSYPFGKSNFLLKLNILVQMMTVNLTLWEIRSAYSYAN